MWLNIASDNLEKVTSSSTLQVLSHVLTHCYKKVRTLPIFPRHSAGPHFSSWWQSGPHISAMVQAGCHSFPGERKCVRAAAAFRGVCVSGSRAQQGRDKADNASAARGWAAQECQLRLQITKMSLKELFCSRKGYRNFS